MYIYFLLSSERPFFYMKMTTLKFAPNLSLMFTEYGSLKNRYQKAAEAGFKAVECVNPFEVCIEELVEVKEKAGLEQVHINAFAGNDNEKGFAAMPGQEDKFLDSITLSIKYAKTLKCQRIHVMSGKTNPNFTQAQMKETYVKNLKKAAAIFEKENIIGLIEPVNQYTVAGYYMCDFALAEEVCKEVNSPHLKLQLDTYHLQILEGNLTRNIERLMPLVGHIQVSQVPNRDELDSNGEINYPYVLDLLKKFGYENYIGLEYKPSGNDTLRSLGWVSKFECLHL